MNIRANAGDASAVAPQACVICVVPIVAGIGNALLAQPMLRRLLARNPNVRIIVLARTDAMGEVMRRLDREWPGRVIVHVTGGGWGGYRRMVSLERQARADVFLSPFPSNRWQYNLLAMMSGARRRVMHSYPVGRVRALGFLPADRVAAVRGLHDVEQNMRMLPATGLVDRDAAAGPFEKPDFPIDRADRERGALLLERAGLGAEDSFIAVHAGSANTPIGAAKRWPAEKYAALARTLINQMDCDVLLIEGPDEIGSTAEIKTALPDDKCSARVRTIRLAENLGDTAAVLARAELYVGSDSGLAHLAAAVGIRAVTLFAPADPNRACPFGNRDLVVQVNKACSPCLRYPWTQTRPRVQCGRRPCIAEIEVDAVMETAARAIGGGQ